MNDALQQRAPEIDLAVRDAKTAVEVKSPQQNRTEEVNEALLPAYQKASELKLTDAEDRELQRPFSDDEVEIRPHDGLLYIPHIHISNRLTTTLGGGQWSMIRRREWIEGNRIYAEFVMKVRGCYVGESVGAMDYHPNNPRMNYADALEGTRGECIRRIAAKDLACGSQVWDPAFCRRWIAQYAEQKAGKWQRKPDPTAGGDKAPPAPNFSPPNGTTSQPKPWEQLTPPERITQILSATAVKKWPEAFEAALRNAGILTEDQTRHDLLPQHFADMSRRQARELVAKTEELAANPPQPEPAPSEPQGGEPAEPSPQQRLCELILASGFTFDQWIQWAVEIGLNDDKEWNLASFDDVPSQTAAACLKNSKTMLKSLLSLNPKSKEGK